MKYIPDSTKVVFFDVGYTLEWPASGDWMLTNRFYELAGDALKNYADLERFRG